MTTLGASWIAQHTYTSIEPDGPCSWCKMHREHPEHVEGSINWAAATVRAAARTAAEAEAG